MKVLLVHTDGSMPNRALMVISAYHKARGDLTYLKRGLGPIFPLQCFNPDYVYISCVFQKNREETLTFSRRFRCPVEIGGPGYDLSVKLPDEIEHLRPDYDLYGISYSIGFTSRGCNRKCPWCTVWKKEGNIRFNAPIEEFLHPNHKRLILLDGNFLASPRWYEELRKIIAYKLKVNFNQGLDIRLLDQENAKWLSKTKYYDWKFKNRILHFAFDTPEMEDEVVRGIETLEQAGIPRKHLMFYVLVGYNTTYEQDLHRINILIKEGVKPYVMPFNDRRDRYYPHLERWVNDRFYEIVPWEKYDSGNSQEIIQSLLRLER